jgi:hypothetical protein
MNFQKVNDCAERQKDYEDEILHEKVIIVLDDKNDNDLDHEQQCQLGLKVDKHL